MTTSWHNFPMGCQPVPSDTPSQLPSTQQARLYTHFHRNLALEYQLHCTHLVNALNAQPPQDCTSLAQTALRMAELLEVIYTQQLGLYTQAHRLHRDQNLYRQYLNPMSQQEQEQHEDDSCFTERIRQTTAASNFWRLLALRSRRLLLSLHPIYIDLSRCSPWMSTAGGWTNATLTHVGWLFFIPRLLANTTHLLKHTIPGNWMTEQEQQLGWQTRLKLQWEMCWLEYINDAGWASVNLYNAFALTGSWAPLGAYLSLAMQSVDVLITSIRLMNETARFRKLQDAYHTRLNQADCSDKEKQAIEQHLCLLQQVAQREITKYRLSVLGNVIVLAVLCCTLPFVVAPPLVPIAANFCSVVSTLTIRYYNQTLDTPPILKHPSAAVLKAHGLFRLASPAPGVEYLVELPLPSPSSE